MTIQSTKVSASNDDIFAPDKVLDLCEKMPKLERKRTLRTVNKDSNSDILTFGEVMAIWFADLIHLLPITPDERLLVFDELWQKILVFGLTLGQAIGLCNPLEIPKGTQLPVAYVGLGDRRFIALTMEDELLDLSNGEWVSGSKIGLLETIQYNLTTMFMRRYNRLWQLKQESMDATSNQRDTNIG